METSNSSIKQPDNGDRRKTPTRRVFGDRRKTADRRSGTDRRSGWGKIEEERLQGALAATASIVYQLSRPFTIILGYVELLIARTTDEYTKKKLTIIKAQLQNVARILDSFREVDDFKTIDFDGMDILDTDILLDMKTGEKKRSIF